MLVWAVPEVMWSATIVAGGRLLRLLRAVAASTATATATTSTTTSAFSFSASASAALLSAIILVLAI